ncbi:MULTISPECIES: hypothetical protein [Sulfurimonas]|uniref:Uncharacterized protein n=1 Tax=Sulfurimonas diazotrophicus TaxID=3131939 RepID=A0ABZ3HCI8_9BACT
MRLFYYVHTGHRIGLDRFRRAATIIRALGDVDITLLSSDFRIASMAREHGIKRAVGVDVVRNIPQIANNGDKIIFDSAEINPVMLDDMTRYFSTFIRISDDPNEQKHPDELLISPYLEGEGVFKGVAVDDAWFEEKPKTIKRAFFFGDDDYEEDLAANAATFAGLELELLEGFYWFYGYGEKLKGSFTALHDEEAYDAVIAGSECLVTSSPQAVLEHLAAGGKPIYLQREDYPTDFIPLFESLTIPVIHGFNKSALSEALNKMQSHTYHACPKNSEKLATFLKQNLDLY